jgi:hypothetical protein
MCLKMVMIGTTLCIDAGISMGKEEQMISP